MTGEIQRLLLGCLLMSFIRIGSENVNTSFIAKWERLDDIETTERVLTPISGQASQAVSYRSKIVKRVKITLQDGKSHILSGAEAEAAIPHLE